MTPDQITSILRPYGLTFIEEGGLYAVFRGDVHIFNVDMSCATERSVTSTLTFIHAKKLTGDPLHGPD